MSTTLSKGYKRPDTGDRGSVFFPDLENNINLVNAHKHDGTDGEKVAAKDLVKASDTVLAASWGADLGGSTYTQSISMSGAATFDDAIMKVVDSASGDIIYPTISKTGTNTYDITINDNTLTLVVTYG